MIEHVESRIFFPMQAVKIKKEITVASRSGCQAATPTDTQKWYSNSTFSISSLEPGCQSLNISFKLRESIHQDHGSLASGRSRQ